MNSKHLEGTLYTPPLMPATPQSVNELSPSDYGSSQTVADGKFDPSRSPRMAVRIAPRPQALSGESGNLNTNGMSSSPPMPIPRQSRAGDVSYSLSSSSSKTPGPLSFSAESSASGGTPPVRLPPLMVQSSSSDAEAMAAAARARRRSSNNAARPKFSSSSRSTPYPASANTGSMPKPLNTHSPIALAAAAAVTPERIALLLKTLGPLPIRHITSHLVATIPGFGELSLSKQRRLLIAVLEGSSSTQSIQFNKIGWGRWAVQESGDSAKSESSFAANGSATTSLLAAAAAHMTSNLRRESDSLTGTHSRSGSTNGGPSTPGSVPARTRITLQQLMSDADRRDSISRQLPSHRPPLSPQLAPSDGDVILDGSELYNGSNNAVFSDSDDDEHDTDEEDWRSMNNSSQANKKDQLANGLYQSATPREQDAIAALVQLQSI